MQQILNEIEECPAGTIYEGFFVNGDGDPNTTVPEDEVMTEICIPTAQLNVIKTTTCDIEEFGQEFCDSIREPKISVLGNNPILSFFFGTEPTGTPVSLGPGAYHVDEAGFTEGLEPCKKMGFDGGRNLGDSIPICTNFSDECQGDITIGNPQTCTIDNVLVEQNFLDLVTANQVSTGTVSILLGTGTVPLFGTATQFPTLGNGPDTVAVGDFNGDGILDVVAANVNSNTVSIFLGTGTGSFGTATTFPTGGPDPTAGLTPRSVAVGDFNGDGKLDLVTANSASNTVSILLGTGTGSFGTATQFPTPFGTGPFSVAVGDFNGDVKLDLVTANLNSANVSIFLGTGTGSFGTATQFPTLGTFPRSVAVGDFNGDVKLDLVTANAISNTVSILIGNGDGTFGTVQTPATTFPTLGTFPTSVAVGDFNGDGILDLVTANIGSNTVSIFLGTGTGSFGAATQFPTVETSPSSVAVGDFN